jgi:cytochrome P450
MFNDDRSSLLSWATHFICEHPDVQEKAHQEVMDVLGGRLPTAEDLPKLRYVKAIMEETLRVRPIVPMLPMRKSAEEGMAFYTPIPE